MVYCMLDQEECHKFGNCKSCDKEGNNFFENNLTTNCYQCKEKEAVSGANFCSEECKTAYYENAFQELQEFEEKEQLGRKNRRKFMRIHQRIINYQTKIAEAKQEYWELWDYFNDENGIIWKSTLDRDKVVNKLEEKFGIVNRR